MPFAEAELERAIRSNIETIVVVLALIDEEIHRSKRALQLYAAVVENEKATFQMGISTLFDVIQAEENLTRALSHDIFALQRNAIGLLYLRYETGTLMLSGGGENLSLPAEHLTSIPTRAMTGRSP